MSRKFLDSLFRKEKLRKGNDAQTLHFYVTTHHLDLSQIFYTRFQFSMS
jgi:hypothetical protein